MMNSALYYFNVASLFLLRYKINTRGSAVC